MPEWLTVGISYNQVNVQTYLYFAGNCTCAIELYKSALGAEVQFVARFADAPEALQVPGKEHLIFHATLIIGNTHLNMSDDPKIDESTFGGFALLVHLDTPEAVELAVERLAYHGKILVPAQQTPWAHRYAIAQDPFGITWKLQFSQD